MVVVVLKFSANPSQAEQVPKMTKIPPKPIRPYHRDSPNLHIISRPPIILLYHLKMPPAKNKAHKKSNKATSIPNEPVSLISRELQQLLLNIFQSSFSERLQSDIRPLLQEVKTHLFNRDFLQAFGREDYLEAYAARWSPSRTLGYAEILAGLQDIILPESDTSPHQRESGSVKIVSIGGGAGAEIVAFGGILHHLFCDDAARTIQQRKFDLVAIDIANWAAVVDKLRQNIVSAPPLSKYASAAAKATNVPLIAPENLDVTFIKQDILNIDIATTSDLMRGTKLVTIMFTLNELYSTSVPLTQKFLFNLTATVEEGTFLLVVDSPGSYSTVTLNGAEKKYPMQWLLDHTLLREGEKSEEASWIKVSEDESRWWRQGDGLKYPIELENMRFQLHLYKRLA